VRHYPTVVRLGAAALLITGVAGCTGARKAGSTGTAPAAPAVGQQDTTPGEGNGTTVTGPAAGSSAGQDTGTGSQAAGGIPGVKPGTGGSAQGTGTAPQEAELAQIDKLLQDLDGELAGADTGLGVAEEDPSAG
jgi:hypothetical protein